MGGRGSYYGTSRKSNVISVDEWRKRRETWKNRDYMKQEERPKESPFMQQKKLKSLLESEKDANKRRALSIKPVLKLKALEIKQAVFMTNTLDCPIWQVILAHGAMPKSNKQSELQSLVVKSLMRKSTRSRSRNSKRPGKKSIPRLENSIMI